MPPRLIPVLQISDGYLVKTTKFAKPHYIGDPINAVKIFNDKRVDELVICDIDATKKGQAPDFSLLESIASEAFMPVGYGGGLRTVEDAVRILSLGMEKVVLNTALQSEPKLIRDLADIVGSQSIVVSVDVRRSVSGKYGAYISSGKTPTGSDPVDWARTAVANGAGEILINSIDRDGTSAGYDLELVRRIADGVSVPVVALGGAGKFADFQAALDAGATAVGAASFFVFHGKHRAVLITYPGPAQIASLNVGVAS